MTALNTEIAKRVAENFGATESTFNKCGITFEEFVIKNKLHVLHVKDEDNSYPIYGGEIKLGEQVLSVLVSKIEEFICIWHINDVIYGAMIFDQDGDIYKFDKTWQIISDRAKANILVGAISLADSSPTWSKINTETLKKILPSFYSLVESDLL